MDPPHPDNAEHPIDTSILESFLDAEGAGDAPVEPTAIERAALCRWENAVLETPFRAFLLVDTGLASGKLHLATTDFAETGRPAIPDDWDLEITAAELEELARTPAWSSRTMCGRPWSHLDFSQPRELVHERDDRLCTPCRSHLLRLFGQDVEDFGEDAWPAMA